MRKVLKLLGSLLVLAVLLVAALAVYVSTFFDPNDFRDRAAQYVRDRTGREFSISGDIKLSFFPWLGLQVGQVELGNAKGFGSAPFARVAQTDVRVKLMPLLKKRVEADTIILRGLELNLARSAGGKTNWDDLAPGTTSAGGQPAAQAIEKGSTTAAGLAVSGVELSDARVEWNDATTGDHYVVQHLDVSSGQLVPGKAFPLQASFDLTAKQPAMTGRLAFGAEVTADPELGRYQLQGVQLDLNLQGAELPNGAAELKLRAEVLADLPPQTLTVSDLSVEAYGLHLDGELHGASIIDHPQFKGALKLTELSPRELLPRLGMTVPVTADAQVLQKLALQTELEATTSRLRLQQLSLALDDTKATGSAGVADFASGALDFDLRVDGIDLDRYLPPPAPEGQAGAPATPAGATAGAAAELPLEALRALNLDGKLHLDRLKVAKLTATDINLRVAAKNGLVQISPVNAALYQGRYDGNIRLDAKGKALGVAVDEQLKQVQAGPLLTDLLGKDRLTGTANVSAKLTASGRDAAGLKRTLNGDAAFTFLNGAVKGVNIAQLIRDAQAKLKGQAAAASNEPNQTDFSELKGTIQVRDGVAHNNDLEAKSPLLRVTGKGQADLVHEQIDYLVSATIVGSLEGQGGRELTELKGVTIPVKVTGSFDKPKYAVDVNALLSDQTKAKLEEKKKELEQKATDKLKDKLQGLFR
jgi:AsmA protein